MSDLYGFFSHADYARELVAFLYTRRQGEMVVVTRVAPTPDAHFPHADDLIVVGQLDRFIGHADATDVAKCWPQPDAGKHDPAERCVL